MYFLVSRATISQYGREDMCDAGSLWHSTNKIFVIVVVDVIVAIAIDSLCPEITGEEKSSLVSLIFAAMSYI